MIKSTRSEILSIFSDFDDQSRYIGVMCVGSIARGDATEFSDIDLVFVSENEPEDERSSYELLYRDDWLVSLSVKSLSKAMHTFTDPVESVQFVQGFRDGIILRDSIEQDLAQLQQTARSFSWTSELTEKANSHASYLLMGNAEEVHKVLRGLSHNDHGAMLNGAWGLSLAMPMILALKFRILAKGENLLRTQVVEAVGIDSAWGRYHAIATGALNAVPFKEQCVAAFLLYEETVNICKEIMLQPDKDVALKAVEIGRKSGLIPQTL